MDIAVTIVEFYPSPLGYGCHHHRRRILSFPIGIRMQLPLSWSFTSLVILSPRDTDVAATIVEFYFIGYPSPLGIRM